MLHNLTSGSLNLLVNHKSGNHEWQTRSVVILLSRIESTRLTPVVADTMKGSYYANPVLDVPNVSAELRQAYPEYYGKNICKASYSRIIVPQNLTRY